MAQLTYRNRRAAQIENHSLRVTVTVEGGHIAEILHKATGINPLWTPPWPSIEPSTYDPSKHPEYGAPIEGRLLAGILGHNICLDIFGPPSPEEAAAGLTVHGEAPVIPYEISSERDQITMSTTLPHAQLRFKRHIELDSGGTTIRFSETIENLAPIDRPIGWTQHATLGPPFLERGSTQFRASATRSKVAGAAFTPGEVFYQPDAEFDWPLCPARQGKTADLQVFTAESHSGGFTTHLIDPQQEHAWFVAWSPTSKVGFGYIWKREDFPWLGRWEENHLRTQPPWNGRTLTCGMEFGASPFPEPRRDMVTRGELFKTPAYRWLPARSRLQADYCAFIGTAESIPENVAWNGRDNVQFPS